MSKGIDRETLYRLGEVLPCTLSQLRETSDAMSSNHLALVLLLADKGLIDLDDLIKYMPRATSMVDQASTELYQEELDEYRDLDPNMVKQLLGDPVEEEELKDITADDILHELLGDGFLTNDELMDLSDDEDAQDEQGDIEK